MGPAPQPAPQQPQIRKPKKKAVLSSSGDEFSKKIKNDQYDASHENKPKKNIRLDKYPPHVSPKDRELWTELDFLMDGKNLNGTNTPDLNLLMLLFWSDGYWNYHVLGLSE
jgi:hypothetical protein